MECQIIIHSLTFLAQAVLENNGPGSFFTLMCLVCTAMTLGQYSPVQPLCSVNKKLLFRGHVISFHVELISRAVPSHSKVTLH